MRKHTPAVWLVRWISLLPPRARLDRQIVRMPDSHSRAGSILLFHSTPLLPARWRQPPRPHDSAANSTPAGFTVHLAQLHLWLSSPSRNAGLFTTWAHSHDPTVIAVSISRSHMGEKRSDCSIACWWQQISKWWQSGMSYCFIVSRCRLNVSLVWRGAALMRLHVAD